MASDDSESVSGTAPQAPAPRRIPWAVVGLLVMVGLYFGVTGWIRSHVDRQIGQQVGQVLPDVAMVDRDGVTWSPESLRDKRVLVHFFRSHCPACTAAVPALRRLEASLEPDEALIGIMTDPTMGFAAEVTAATLADYGFTHPVVMADDELMDAFHGVTWSRVTPVGYVVDASGRIVTTFRGPQSFETLRDALRQAP